MKQGRRGKAQWGSFFKIVKPERTLLSRCVPGLVAGMTVWLVGLKELSDLIGDECVVIKDMQSLGVRIRRTCVNETLNVQRNNIALRPPHSAEESRLVLERVMGAEVSHEVMRWTECQRCWKRCTAGSRCWVPHPVKHQTFLGQTLGGGGQWNYGCGACNRVYARDGRGLPFQIVTLC